MAYAALASLAQTLEQILNHDKYSIFLQGKQRLLPLISLYEYVIFLQAFLENFPEKANNLEGRIRDVANRAEDILEYLMYERIHSLMSSRRPQNVNSSSHQDMFQLHYQKLPQVTEDIGSIAEEVTKIKNSFGIEDLRLRDSSPPSFSSMQLSESSPPNSSSMLEMVGFDDDLIAIKNRLRAESSKREVIPIVGMGGIGKTTLARNAFDDPFTVDHFDIRAWVTVSQGYSKQKILLSLLNSIKASNEVFHEERRRNEPIEVQVHKSLMGRRYLIVMDDMWSINTWDDVIGAFPNAHNGSRIILTTRLSDVAAYAGSSSPLHEMRFMNVDQSWNLLRQKVFKEEHCPPELEHIGKEIARSCGGLPLATVVIAGILSTVSQIKASWQIIAENVKNLVVTANDEQLDRILTLSYTYLPHHLRPCFLYMGDFPEDYEIDVWKLIKLWVAEGFIKASASKSFEEGAEEYLEDLVKRSLVLVIGRKCNGKIKRCSVHDLVRDLCIGKSQEENFLLYAMKKYVDEVHRKSKIGQRRLSKIGNGTLLYKLASSHGPTIRTILHFQNDPRLLSSFESFRLLRVLDAVKLRLQKFPAEVLKLFLLRYLALGYSLDEGKFIIPASIVRLQNLQTLFIVPVISLQSNRVRFPPGIGRMAQLRHVFVPCSLTLRNPCARASVLENLQTLSVVRDFKCTERILQMIPNLKKLGIVYSGYRIEWAAYQLHNLVHLHQLENLSIRMITGIECRIPLREYPAFPMTLKKLNLEGFAFRGQHMEIFGSFPYLEVRKLQFCSFVRGKWETTEGQFPQLKYLAIKHANLKHWITDSSHFPSLKRLGLFACMGLDEIPDVIGEIPTLELIEVLRWDLSLVESAKRIKEEQQSNFGNDSLQVRLIVMTRYILHLSVDLSLTLEPACL